MRKLTETAAVQTQTILPQEDAVNLKYNCQIMTLPKQQKNMQSSSASKGNS